MNNNIVFGEVPGLSEPHFALLSSYFEDTSEEYPDIPVVYDPELTNKRAAFIAQLTPDQIKRCEICEYGFGDVDFGEDNHVRVKIEFADGNVLALVILNPEVESTDDMPTLVGAFKYCAESTLARQDIISYLKYVVELYYPVEI